MIAFNDQWPSSLPRFYDIADQLFKKTLPPGTIQFRYDPSPGNPWLVGEIKGWNLKPNFCYQLKLAGKPGTSTGGLWGAEADMATNGAILTNGRWWNYQTEDAAFNTTNAAVVMRSRSYKDGWVAGYVYFGYVLTDEKGSIKCYGGKTEPAVADASGWVPISANRCYHITAKTGQSGFTPPADTAPIAYDLTQSDYGYANPTSGTTTISLWYEKEPDNPLDFSLPAGNHDVVLVVTEESFHNNLGGLTNTEDGGYWDTVWVSDWSLVASPKTGGSYTTARGGPIRFTTGGSAAAPTATIVNPADGSSVGADSTVTVKMRATASRDLTVAWSLDGGTPIAAVYNEASACYEALWSTAGLALGSTHTIQAVATDTGGAAAMDTSLVTITGNHPPAAAFTSTQNGSTCTFTSTSTDSDGTIADCAWTFGDGGTGTGSPVSHTYAAGGSYVVTLTVTDNDGATGSASSTVTITTNVMTSTTAVQWLGKPGKYQANAIVTVKANGVPLSGATVTGYFSGAFNSKSSSQTTDANGTAVFYGPPNQKTNSGALAFNVTNIAKSGYTWQP
ncbi:MAG: PKD domain-containing protein [Armatimonadetes bacterium]|nr:PKD domain-containing protein [Armatimonadota bacterium]